MVPANKVLFSGTVPANKVLFAGTAPANKVLFFGKVPANFSIHKRYKYNIPDRAKNK